MKEFSSVYQILLLVQYASIGVLFLEAAFIFRRWRTNLQGVLFFCCVSMLVNNTGYLFEMISNNEGEYRIALQMSYLGKAWIPFTLLLFVLKLCNIKYSKILVWVLALIHASTFVLVLTTQSHEIYYRNVRYVRDGLYPHLTSSPGVWHMGYSLLMVCYIVFGISNLIIYAKREKNALARKRLFLVLISYLIDCGFYLFGLTRICKGYDPTVLGYTLGALVMCYAIFKYDLLDTLEVGRDFVIDDIPEGILIMDQYGKREYMNRVAKEIFDGKEKDSELTTMMEASIAMNEPIVIGEHYYSPEKKILQHKGVDRGIAYILVDDTEHFRYMETLKEEKRAAEMAREEAVRARQDEEKAREAAEAASASKSAFLSVVSHEIRTPMNAVVGMTELLLRDKEALNTKQDKYLRNIKTSGEALVMIVNDILDQSKIEAGKMEIIDEAYELRPMLSDVKLIIENRIGSKPIHLIYEVDDEVPQFLVGDSLRIRQILINLMNNAVKFTEEGFIQLRIECMKNKDGKCLLKFSVRDSGQGIKEDDLAKLGQAFTQVDTRKNHQKEGTGLGLSISKDFIAMMGGQLEVTSEYGKGTEFFFSIWQQVTKGIEVSAGSGVSKQAWQSEENFTAEGAKILVVDDASLNLMILEELLEPLAMDVETAESGEQALELVKKNQYHLVFMDYMMPYMDGVETTEKIRAYAREAMEAGEEAKAEYFRSLPIITLSGDTSEETKEKFMRAGIDDFTEKPVDLKQIKKLLLKWLPKEYIHGKG